ncbi:MAG: hypothetical protein ACOX7D_04155 [Alphaproteobacteria bacterium]|jgi:hypothetical protein
MLMKGRALTGFHELIKEAAGRPIEELRTLLESDPEYIQAEREAKEAEKELEALNPSVEVLDAHGEVLDAYNTVTYYELVTMFREGFRLGLQTGFAAFVESTEAGSRERVKEVVA